MKKPAEGAAICRNTSSFGLIRPKRIMWFLTAALLFALAGCGAAPDYTDDLYTEAVRTYMAEYTRAEADEVMISCPIFYKINDRNKDDIMVWGDFRAYSYALRNTTMMVGSSFADQGVMHLKAVDGEYVVTDFEIFGNPVNGDHYFSDVVRLCAPDIGLILRVILTSDVQRETARLDSLCDYAEANGIKITQYQYHGWAPVAISGMPATAEEEQIIHWESDLGYSLEYDLRQLSLSRYDDSSEGLWGVEELSGCSLGIERYRDQSRESVLETVERTLREPIREPAVIGADGIEATLVRDGSLSEEIMEISYLVPLGENDWLVVSVENTYFAVSTKPIVSEADSVLLQTLESFRLHT